MSIASSVVSNLSMVSSVVSNLSVAARVVSNLSMASSVVSNSSSILRTHQKIGPSQEVLLHLNGKLLHEKG